MGALADRLRTLRRRLKLGLPYVRRREHRILQRKYAALIEALDGGASAASDARLRLVKPLPSDLAGEVCLFVTFADEPRIKPHVIAHVSRLIAARIEVVLIVNTELAPDTLAIDPALLEGARAVVIRQNLGYDFAAWAHVLALCPGAESWTRLFLVNDSIVGPLDETAFERMLARIRTSKADVIGLTEAGAPMRHLQSYFLVFAASALKDGAVRRFFSRVRNWPSKSQVIDVHETRLTAALEGDGLRCEALFPALSGDALSSDDTSLRWAELFCAGFPYLKTRVIAKHAADPRIRTWLGALKVD